MQVKSYTAVRNNFAKTMEMVCEEHTPLTVTRKDNPSVVILSSEDYDALQETAYLLQSPENAKRLLESIDELESGEGLIKELIE